MGALAVAFQVSRGETERSVGAISAVIVARLTARTTWRRGAIGKDMAEFNAGYVEAMAAALASWVGFRRHLGAWGRGRWYATKHPNRQCDSG